MHKITSTDQQSLALLSMPWSKVAVGHNADINWDDYNFIFIGHNGQYIRFKVCSVSIDSYSRGEDFRNYAGEPIGTYREDTITSLNLDIELIGGEIGRMNIQSLTTAEFALNGKDYRLTGDTYLYPISRPLSNEQWLDEIEDFLKETP